MGGLGRGFLGAIGRCLGTGTGAATEVKLSGPSFLSIGSSSSAIGLGGGEGGGPDAFMLPLGETLPEEVSVRCLGIIGTVG